MKNIKNIASKLTGGVLMGQSLIVSAHAGDLAGSSIVTGTTALVNDITAILMGMSIAVGGAVATFCLIRRSMADETDGKMWKNRAITAGVCGVLGILVSGIISVIAGYYGG